MFPINKNVSNFLGEDNNFFTLSSVYSCFFKLKYAVSLAEKNADRNNKIVVQYNGTATISRAN